MTIAQRDLASPELWDESLERSLRRRALAPRVRREHNRRKRLSLAVAAATMAGPGTPAALAQASGDLQAQVAAETPSQRAIELREGGLPLQVGSEGPLVVEVQKAVGVPADGIFGPQTDAAVRDYQGRSGLPVDGIVGPVTWSALFAGSAVGGSDVPQQVRESIERRLDSAGDGREVGTPAAGETAPQGPAPAPQAAPPTPTVPAPAPDQATGSCGASTVATPVNGTVSSPYGPRGGRNHDGVDIAAPSGTAVRAAACGSVTIAGQQSGYGNIVCITHTSRFSTCYAHLSRFATSQGAQVKQGQVIGYVGCTGNCTGPHLHFETRVDGQAQNPTSYLNGSSIPGKTTAAASGSGSGKAGASVAKASAGGGATVGSTWEQTGIEETGTEAASETLTPGEAPAGSAVPAQATPPVAAPAAPPAAEPPPVEAAPVEVAPVEAAPVEAAPVEAAPVESAPVEAAPVAPAPVEAAPVEPAPVEAAPVAAAPVEAAPIEPAPVEPPAVTTAEPAPAY